MSTLDKAIAYTALALVYGLLIGLWTGFIPLGC